MRTIADHLFDILENSVSAQANKVVVNLSFSKNIFYCHILDDGKATKLDNIIDPFVTSRKTRRVGLGLPLLKATAEGTGGYINIYVLEKKKGTRLEFCVNMKHINARPFGNLAAVFSDVLRSWPNIDFEVYINQAKENVEKKVLDTAELKKTLEVKALDHDEIINYVKEHLKIEFLNIDIDEQFGIL